MALYEVLYNPLAGNGSCETQTRALSNRLTGDTLHYHDITKITDYPAFLAGLPADSRLLISGGDGTLNRFINDTIGLSFPQDVYYYAAGSGNDFLRNTPYQKGDPPFCINDYLKNLPTVEIDGTVRTFLNGIGYGIDGYCCEVGEQLRGTTEKEINYAGIAVKGLLFHFRPRSATVTVDGVRRCFRKVWLAPTMNGRFYGGGMIPTPDQDIRKTDSVSVMVMYGSGKLKTLMIFPSIFSGKHVTHQKQVAVLTGHTVTVTFDQPTPLQVDGELFPAVTSYTVRAGAPAAAEKVRDAAVSAP